MKLAPPPPHLLRHSTGRVRLMVQIKKVIDTAIRKSPHRADDKYLIDAPLTFPHTVDLAHRNPHRLSQLGQVPVPAVTQIENPCLNDYRAFNLRSHMSYYSQLYAICQYPGLQPRTAASGTDLPACAPDDLIQHVPKDISVLGRNDVVHSPAADDFHHVTG